jgi:polysaccharide deacetylase 2 family uncharacterized protein YibQ
MAEDFPQPARPVRPMARPRRRVGRLALVGLVVLVGVLAAYLARRKPSVPEARPPLSPTTEAAAPWRARPGETRAFSDSLGVRLEGAFAGLGIPAEKIRRGRSKREGLLSETTVEVPKDLPLAVCNLEVVRQAERIGGGVLSATEALGGVSVTIQAGLGGTATDRIVLQADPNATRPAGAVALVVCATRGQDEALAAAFCALEQRVTLAFFPDREVDPKLTARARSNGHGVMIQFSMADAGDKVGEAFRRAMDRVPDAAGVIGDLAEGRISEDERAMAGLLSEVRRRGMFFVDGRASAASAAYRTALRMGIRAGESVIRVDEEEGAETIREALNRLADLSGVEGRAFGVARATANTLVAMREALPLLERRGVRFVRAEQIVKK